MNLLRAIRPVVPIVTGAALMPALSMGMRRSLGLFGLTAGAVQLVFALWCPAGEAARLDAPGRGVTGALGN